MNEQTSIFSAMNTSSAAKTSAAATAQDTARAVATPVAAPKVISKPIHGHKRASTLDEMYKALVEGVAAYFQENNFTQGVIGVSGGVDSALTLKICVDALGADNVTAFIMPELGLSKQENIDHASALCEFFGVTQYFQPINNFLREFNVLPWELGGTAKMNTKARVRALLLYSFANTQHALVLGTSNKSEILLGYGTKYGDLAADIEVIGDLLKTDVVKLANHIGLPPEITNKAPTAELAPGQTDEQEMGAPYKDMDQVLAKLDLGEKGCLDHGFPPELVELVFHRVHANKHKRELPPVIRVA